MINITENIKKIMSEKDITQEQMAEKFAVKQSTVSNWLNRSVDMPFGRLTQIADALGVSVLYIITYPEVYVKDGEQKAVCENCKLKDETIRNLNDYIKTLKRRK